MATQQNAQQQSTQGQQTTFQLPAQLPFGPEIIDRDIFELIGLKDIADKDRAEMMTVIMDTIYNRVIARILDNFNPQEQKELEKGLEKKDLKKVNEMLAGKELPDYMTLLAEETVLYKVQLATMFAPKAA
ncbi:MAG: hypothetical protein AAB400_01225 [Patescibacteria group bacterium]